MPFADRRAEPGAVIRTQDEFGNSVRMTADDDGVVKIRNAQQEAAADRLQLSVVREAKAEGDKPTTEKKEG